MASPISAGDAVVFLHKGAHTEGTVIKKVDLRLRIQLADGSGGAGATKWIELKDVQSAKSGNADGQTRPLKDVTMARKLKVEETTSSSTGKSSSSARSSRGSAPLSRSRSRREPKPKKMETAMPSLLPTLAEERAATEQPPAAVPTSSVGDDFLVRLANAEAGTRDAKSLIPAAGARLAAAAVPPAPMPLAGLPAPGPSAIDADRRHDPRGETALTDVRDVTIAVPQPTDAAAALSVAPTGFDSSLAGEVSLTSPNLNLTTESRTAADLATRPEEVEQQQRVLPTETRHALSGLDDRLAGVLGSGDIALVRSAWLLAQKPSYRIVRRQDLAPVGSIRPLLDSDEAVQLLREGRRAVGVLSYGWPTSGNPDPNGDRVQCMRRALEERPDIKAFFWDGPSLFQHPRTVEQERAFKNSLDVVSKAPAPHPRLQPPGGAEAFLGPTV